MPLQFGLEGKVVAITGAASGIGQATALAFAQHDARVGLIDIDEGGLRATARAIEDREGTATVVVADLSTRGGAEEAVQQVIDAHGDRLDVLINNVGICVARSFDELNDDDWMQTLEVNFMSCVRATRTALPVMRGAGAGCILNMASDLARQPEASPVDYQVAKVGIVSLTKALALAEGPAIRINAVAPGPIWTPLWTRPGGFAETLGKVHELPPREAVEHELSLRQLPLRRTGEPDEVANVFVFLASDAASFVTGSVWGVDGGSIRGLL